MKSGRADIPTRREFCLSDRKGRFVLIPADVQAILLKTSLTRRVLKNSYQQSARKRQLKNSSEYVALSTSCNGNWICLFRSRLPL